MAVLLVRHAHAGDRDEWEGPDHLRPLSAKGRRQAESLVRALAGFPLDRVLSSPYLRCTETVEPLASVRGTGLERCDALAEGNGRDALDLVLGLAGAPIVLCTHGDVVEDVLDGLGVDRSEETEKGATWVLDGSGARGLPAPG